MPIIAVSGRKGGVGKTTLAAHIAAAPILEGKKAVAFDADPQGSLLAWAGLGEGILSTITTELASKSASTFRRAVEAASERADLVVIDTAPGFHEGALNAALVADAVLLPIGPSPLDVIAASEALELLHKARAERGGKLPRVGLVPSKVTTSKISKDLPAILAGMGEHVLHPIGNRAAVPDAAAYGLTVFEHAPRTPAGGELWILADEAQRLARGRLTKKKKV